MPRAFGISCFITSAVIAHDGLGGNYAQASFFPKKLYNIKGFHRVTL
ncbi:MAG: hypothetical protein GX767_08505 [Firmicutes bacterium]|nr:hypothetical protein [Bacillota bacterium]